MSKALTQSTTAPAIQDQDSHPLRLSRGMLSRDIGRGVILAVFGGFEKQAEFSWVTHDWGGWRNR